MEAVKKLRLFAPKDNPWVYRLQGKLIATDGVAAAVFADAPGGDDVFGFDLKPASVPGVKPLRPDFLALLNDYEAVAVGVVKVADLRRALRMTRGVALRLYADGRRLMLSGAEAGEVECPLSSPAGRGVLYVDRKYFAKALSLGLKGQATVVIPRQASRPHPLVLHAGPWSVYIAPLAYWPPVPLPVLDGAIAVEVDKDDIGSDRVVSRLGLAGGEGQIELPLPPDFAAALGRWLVDVRPFYEAFIWPETRDWQPGGRLMVSLYPMLKDDPDRCALVIQYYSRIAVMRGVELAWDELRSWGRRLLEAAG